MQKLQDPSLTIGKEFIGRKNNLIGIDNFNIILYIFEMMQAQTLIT